MTNGTLMTSYKVVKVPEDLKHKFERLNKERHLGYTTFTEFVKDALRRRFEEIISTYDEG